MKKFTAPTLRTHVYNAGHALRLSGYIEGGGFFAGAEEASSPSGRKAAEAHSSIECRRGVPIEEARMREVERMGVVAGKWCFCCRTELVASSSSTTKESYCNLCKRDLQRTTYHLRRAFAAKRPDDGVCMLCNRVSKVIVLEHSHRTGRARGWVCNRCNATLGLVEKDVDAFRRYCLARFQQHIGPRCALDALQEASAKQRKTPPEPSTPLPPAPPHPTTSHLTLSQ